MIKQVQQVRVLLLVEAWGCVGGQSANFGGGFGRGRGRCCGIGWGGFFQGGNAAISLKEEEQLLKQRLKDIQKAQKKS